LINLNSEDLTSQLIFKKTMHNNTHAGLIKCLPVSGGRHCRDRM